MPLKLLRNVNICCCTSDLYNYTVEFYPTKRISLSQLHCTEDKTLTGQAAMGSLQFVNFCLERLQENKYKSLGVHLKGWNMGWLNLICHFKEKLIAYGRNWTKKTRTAAPLLSIYSFKFGSAKTNIEIKQDYSVQSWWKTWNVKDNFGLFIYKKVLVLHIYPRRESLCWKYLIHRSRMNVGHPVLSCQVLFRNVKSNSHDGNSSSSWRSMDFPSLEIFREHWKVNWEGRRVPVALTAGEQVDAFERVQSVSNSFCNLNIVSSVLKISKHVKEL